ncbi:MAG: hypothetical protein O2894_07620 [Planctomycetota bacterium]|nr:hypothetical protein [Planctomycetota bacterium]
MGKLSLVLALAALGLAGWTAAQLCAKDDQLATLERANLDLRDRLHDVELSHDLGADAPAGAMSAVSGQPAAEGATTPGLSGRPATTGDRLRALESQLEAQNKLLAEFKEERAARSTAEGARHRFSPGNFYGNADMAAKAMELNERQQADMKDVLDRAQRELDDLYAIENDEGVTWKDVRKPKLLESSGISIALPDMGKIQKFKQGRIPGSGETFGEAETRIRKDAFGRIRNTLTPAQTEKWDKAHKDSMLGGGGGFASSVAFVEMGSSDAEPR